jgi:hypothetical protein
LLVLIKLLNTNTKQLLMSQENPILSDSTVTEEEQKLSKSPTDRITGEDMRSSIEEEAYNYSVSVKNMQNQYFGGSSKHIESVTDATAAFKEGKLRTSLQELFSHTP